MTTTTGRSPDSGAARPLVRLSTGEEIDPATYMSWRNCRTCGVLIARAPEHEVCEWCEVGR